MVGTKITRLRALWHKNYSPKGWTDGELRLNDSIREQHTTGKIQRNNYYHGNCGSSLTGKTSSVCLIFTDQTHRNVKNR